MGDLILGPLVRYVDDDVATVWVECERDCRVSVVTQGHEASARTFAVHGHHYALVELAGLGPGFSAPYTVLLDGEPVWPATDGDLLARLPPPRLTTLRLDKPLRLAFGSCRTSVTHDKAGNRLHGIDALRAFALRMAGITDAGTADPDPGSSRNPWPDLVLFLGDQVYADETTEPMREFIKARRDIDEPPWTELKDYQEYAHLYRLAWTDEANRWLMSTLPSAMIFDDHDIRDDWNTSQTWKDQMESTTWWHDRIVGGLASYWVYQHLGNLSPAERAEDPVWQRIAAHDGPEEFDATGLLEDFAERADAEPASYRWSYARDLGTQARLVVVDSRAARVLDPERRSILDDGELGWLDGKLRGDVDHLLIGTSLPFLLAPGLHYVEALSEAVAGGGWGRRASVAGEWVRQTVDLEHWAAFQEGFGKVAVMVLQVARGQRGRAPGTITFLSGDVHHSYVSEARPADSHGSSPVEPISSRILQAVCSPIRNPLPRNMRFLTAALSYGIAAPLGHLAVRSAHVPESPLVWGLVKGPWFDNNLAVLEVRGRGLRMWWGKGKVQKDREDAPLLEVVADFTTDERPGRPRAAMPRRRRTRLTRAGAART